MFKREREREKVEIGRGGERKEKMKGERALDNERAREDERIRENGMWVLHH